MSAASSNDSVRGIGKEQQNRLELSSAARTLRKAAEQAEPASQVGLAAAQR